MNRLEFLESFDELLDLPAGTLKGPEPLEGLENWNSLAVISLIALAHERCGIVLQNKQLVLCKSVDDVLRLVAIQD